jgi:hypothetical protein
MLNYWYVWPIGISIWLAIGWAAFAWFESRALKHDARRDQITLSMFCYTIGSKFPLSILIAGIIIGGFIFGLGTHFLWHWCPPGSISAG